MVYQEGALAADNRRESNVHYHICNNTMYNSPLAYNLDQTLPIPRHVRFFRPASGASSRSVLRKMVHTWSKMCKSPKTGPMWPS